MTALGLTVLASSLLGSLHCAGMCGGLVAFATGAGRSRGAWLAHLAYHAGRLAAYGALGALGGAAGATLDLGGSLLGLQRAAAAVAGALIALWGAAALLEALGARVPRLEPPRALGRLVGRALRRIAGRPPAVRALSMGLLTGALPCGWLYAFVAAAAGTGSAPSGALLMAVFWLGTLPVLAGLGLGAQALAGPLRRHAPAVCAVAMIVVGLLAVAGRLQSAPPAAAPAGQHQADHARR
jgi:hypothetical protein